MVQYLGKNDNICFGAEENMILYPTEQIPDQGNAQINKSLRLKRKLHCIKTPATQFPHGMNHKLVRKRDVFITFPFSNNAKKAFKITKDIYKKLQKCIPIYSRANLCARLNVTKIRWYLVSAKLKWGQSMEAQSHLMHQIEPRMAFSWPRSTVQNF